MGVLLLFSLTLLVAVLLSELAQRTVVSTAALFLAVGIAASATGLLHLQADDSTVRDLAELALVSVLFTDGMKVGAREVLAAWRLPGRALLVGLPLTVMGIAIIGVFVAKLSWPAAFLVGAALSPTSPVFAAAFMGGAHVPARLRRLLHIEGGLSEAMALPILLGALAWMGADHVKPLAAVMQLLLGAGIGLAVPVIANFLERLCWLRSSEQYQPILPVAVVLLVYSISELLHANEFIATAVAGVTLATIAPGVSKRFEAMGEWLSELLKLAALLIFGAFFSLHVWREVGVGGIWFALAVIVLVRPIALTIALWQSELTLRERLAAAWIGPKGFASVLFGLLILETELPNRHGYFELIALTIVGSIVAHSSTDFLVAKWFERPADAGV
jgi:NhaP-type Na+/H+ or K+/H+ antiporter